MEFHKVISIVEENEAEYRQRMMDVISYHVVIDILSGRY